MKNLKAKLRKNGGFTLIEMLIVVAIIAILIAVSIPLVANALDKAKEATDKANERSFKAELTIAYLDGAKAAGADFVVGTVYKYDAADGSLAAKNATDVKGYGQSTTVKGKVLLGSIDTNGKVTMGWGDTADEAADTAPLGDFVTSSVGGGG